MCFRRIYPTLGDIRPSVGGIYRRVCIANVGIGPTYESDNETAAKGEVINPWNFEEKRTPGGSSGGSAAAVAAKAALAATGTDTGGSIRQPAAFCGVVGLKPTYGRCSRWGIVAFASSLDQAGPITRNVSDAALMLQVMSGYDPKDSTSSNKDVPNFYNYLGKSIKGIKGG